MEDSKLVLAEGNSPIPDDEVIADPSPAEYTPPAYLQKTAPELALEFEQLLIELRDLNAQFNGQPTVETQARLSFTGEHEWLEEGFYRWCQMYFTIRGNLNRLNAQNNNDPWQLYVDCYEEFDQLIEKRILQPGTINSSVLNLSQKFMLSSFAEKVLEPDLRNHAETGRDRYANDSSRLKAYRRVSLWQTAVSDFDAFLKQIAGHLPQQDALDDGQEWLAEIEAKVSHQAEDLAFLRNILCVLNVNERQKHQLTPNLWASLSWDVYHGQSVAAILSSPEHSTRQLSNHSLAFRRDGWLCHREYPWLRVQPDYLPDERRGQFPSIVSGDLAED